MEIEVGDYVRTKDGIIDKVIIEYDGKCNNSNCNEKHISCKYNYYNEKEIVRHSKKLIDLIEVGDIVHIKDVLHEDITHIWTEDYLKALKEDIQNGIKLVSIVTHEQMQSIEYKVDMKDYIERKENK